MMKTKEIYNDINQEEYISKSYLQERVNMLVRMKKEEMTDWLKEGKVTLAGAPERDIESLLYMAERLGIYPEWMAKKEMESVNKLMDEGIDKLIHEKKQE